MIIIHNVLPLVEIPEHVNPECGAESPIRRNERKTDGKTSPEATGYQSKWQRPGNQRGTDNQGDPEKCGRMWSRGLQNLGINNPREVIQNREKWRTRRFVEYFHI